MRDETVNIARVMPEQRFCPICGLNTDAAACPDDRTPTVMVAQFSKHPKAYQPGDVVAERFKITGSLGAGGFASVFSAEHIGTQQQVALKLMATELGPGGAVAVRRFFREAKVTATLQHPNTVRIFDVGQDSQGPLFMAMELLAGRTLYAELRERITARNLFSEAEAIAIGTQVLDSLAEAHAHRLVHRDLKPANLMLRTDDDGKLRVKVLDFGIARTQDSSLTATGAAPGTPAFMSPEQCRGAEVDGRSDLYALGILLFACTVGRLPFEHRDPLRLLRMHLEEPPPDPRSLTDQPLSEGFVEVLLRSLAKAPADRFPNAASMKAALLAAAHGQPAGPDLPDPPLLGQAAIDARRAADEIEAGAPEESPVVRAPSSIQAPAGAGAAPAPGPASQESAPLPGGAARAQPAPGRSGRAVTAFVGVAAVLAFAAALWTWQRGAAPQPAEPSTTARPQAEPLAPAAPPTAPTLQAAAAPLPGAPTPSASQPSAAPSPTQAPAAAAPPAAAPEAKLAGPPQGRRTEKATARPKEERRGIGPKLMD